MTLIVVNNLQGKEVHLFEIDIQGSVSVFNLETHQDILLEEIFDIFPGIEQVMQDPLSTSSLIQRLQELNYDYVWAHVSGKL